GYTQSGKTTFFNPRVSEHKETGLGPLTTLSTYARRVHYNNGMDAFSFILIDSIGFIEDMHPIILKAFNTTLGEISNSDFILLFIDISEEEEIVFRKLTASNYTLKQIAPKVPLLICINKVDKSEESRVEEGKRLVSRVFPGIPQVTLSALKGRNTEEVLRLSYQHLNDGRLLLSPKIDEERAPLEVVLDASPFVRREIIERYLLGYDIIRVQSKDSFSPDIREEVRRTTKRLVGLEVLEEDSKRIVLQCLVEPSLLNPERILRRLEMLSMPMQLDSVQAFVSSNAELAKGVVERDEEVDRWYFLLVRLVRAAISDTYLLEKIKVSSVDCLDFRLLASYIETFADYSVTIAENTQDGVTIPKEEQALLEKI